MTSFASVGLLYHVYGPLSILLFLCGSPEVWRTLMKFILHSDSSECDKCFSKFWKAQNHNCSMAALGVSQLKAEHLRLFSFDS